MDRLASQLIIDILKEEMQIPNDDIWIRDQNKKIPNDDGLYMIVGMVDAVPLSGGSRMTEFEGDVVEETSVQLRENIQIDIVSKSNDAILRRWEIMAGLRSIYSKQKQEEYGFKVMRLPNSFVNSSVAEGGSQLNRYSVVIGCMVLYKKIKILDPDNSDYYDDFDARVDDKNTISEDDGLIEFNITGD